MKTYEIVCGYCGQLVDDTPVSSLLSDAELEKIADERAKQHKQECEFAHDLPLIPE